MSISLSLKETFILNPQADAIDDDNDGDNANVISDQDDRGCALLCLWIRWMEQLSILHGLRPREIPFRFLYILFTTTINITTTNTTITNTTITTNTTTVQTEQR